MSKLFCTATLVTIIFFLFTPFTKAQTIPDSVLKAFTQKFPKAKQVKWEKESENGEEFEVEFVLNGEEMSAVFNADGNWKETEITITDDELPEEVKQALRRDFKEAEVEYIFRVTTLEQTLFEVIVENEEGEEMGQDENEEEYELTFTMDGKLVKKEERDHSEN